MSDPLFLIPAFVVGFVCLIMLIGHFSSKQTPAEYPPLPSGVGPRAIRHGGYTYFRCDDGYYRYNDDMLQLTIVMMALNETEQQQLFASAPFYPFPAAPADETCARVDGEEEFTAEELAACKADDSGAPTKETQDTLPATDGDDTKEAAVEAATEVVSPTAESYGSPNTD